jgi:uncharacterized protein YcfJ
VAPPPPPVQRPNYAVAGAAVGAVAGGVIGHQSKETLAGALIGGAAGAVIGGVAEHEVRLREQRQAPVVWVSPINNAPTVPNAPMAPAAPAIAGY